jgi:hypothetical protein
MINKLIKSHNTLAFTGTSKDYITKDAVKRANTRLINSMAGHAINIESSFDKYNVTRPTRKQLVEASQKAMRKVVVHG